jgi:hypothetical protein
MSQENSSQVDFALETKTPETLDGARALAELNGLLAVRGSEIVESPRLPGVPLPLQALINACPEPPDENNAHKFLTEALSLLDVADSKKLETDKEDPQEEENSESETAKKKLN